MGLPTGSDLAEAVLARNASIGLPGGLRAMGITGGAEPSGSGSGGGGGGSIVLELNSSGSGIDDWLVEILRRSIRVRGGNAQVVLGQGAAA